MTVEIKARQKMITPNEGVPSSLPTSLVAYGFLDINLHDTLNNICEVLPHAREIARLGQKQTIGQQTWRFLNRSLGNDGYYVGWHIGILYNEGSYGKIYKAQRMIVKRRTDGLFDVAEPSHEVIVKRTMPSKEYLCSEDVVAHTSEALLHVLAWRVMQKTDIPWSIPRPYEVFGDYDDHGWKDMSLCMSYVRGRTLHSYMNAHWKPTTKESNTRSFLHILAQVAYILYHLQINLRLNHRDVKVNNILIRTRPDPFVFNLEGVTWKTTYELTLIDFGFACVGCRPPDEPTTVLQAGTWFADGELCCKAGRDLAQLIFCIHCYYPIDVYLTNSVCAVIKEWMHIPWSGGTANALWGFTKEGRPRRAATVPEYDTGVYEFLRNISVDPVSFSPQKVFGACVDLNAALDNGA